MSLRIADNWRVWSEQEKKYRYSPNGLYPMIQKYVDPLGPSKKKLTLYGANLTAARCSGPSAPRSGRGPS